MTHLNHPTVTYLDHAPAAQPVSLREQAGTGFASLKGAEGVRTWLAAQAAGGQAQSAAPAEASGLKTGTTTEAEPTHNLEGEARSYQMPHEVPNIFTLWQAGSGAHAEGKPGERPEYEGFIHLGPVPVPINPLFSIFYMILIVWVVRKALRRPNIEHPGRLQNAVEALLGGLRTFFKGVMGEVGEKYIPYLGSLFLFILFSNLSGLVPFFKAPTSSIKTTFALGFCTFCYVQYNGIKESGFGGWLYHLLGSPTDVVTWCLSPLFLVLEVIGELVKPVSLSLRLFGNIFGEDKLLASFLGMGMMIVAALFHTAHPIIGVPLHLPFYFLVLLTSTIQATVFSLLAAVYIVLLLPHETHAEEHGRLGPEVAQPSDSLGAAGQV